MTFINEENFKKWLIKTLNNENSKLVVEYNYIFLAWLKDVEDAVFNGYNHVELNHFETESGHPETYYFDVDYTDNNNIIITF